MSKDENNSITISFLFGAGAEGEGNFDLPTGNAYFKETMIFEGKEKVLEALKRAYNKKYFNGSYTYRKAQLPNIKEKVVRQEIWEECKINSRQTSNPTIKEDYCLLTQGDIESLEKELESEEPYNKNFISQLRQMVNNKKGNEIEEYINKRYNALFDEGAKGNDYKYSKLVQGIMDNYFPSIINPKEYGLVRFARIFNYYWISYFTIVEAIAKSYQSHNIKELEKYYTNNQLNYDEILGNINKFTKFLYSLPKDVKRRKKPYYKLLKEELEKENIDISGIATTNYFNFCEILSSKVCYLNGSLNLFEFPETLSVEDFNDENTGKEIDTENELFFPFIFGQSLTKPIVHHKQIEAFNNFKSQLDKCNILVILGYGINEDDNHINAYLREYLISGKSIIYVSKGDKDEREVKEEVRQKLRIKDSDTDKYNIIYVKVDEEKNNEETVNSIIDEIKKIEREKEDAK